MTDIRPSLPVKTYRDFIAGQSLLDRARGVYYIKVPDLPKQRWEEGEGCIQFGAPPPKFVSGRNKTQQLIRPIPGMAVFFPSYYWHGVQPYNMDAIRHSMSFDIL